MGSLAQIKARLAPKIEHECRRTSALDYSCMSQVYHNPSASTQLKKIIDHK
jgi:hypothetical protein